MTKDEIITKLEKHGYFYGYMYVTDHNASGEIIKIKLDTAVTITSDAVYFIWGLPGPDFNEYHFSDYGKTWAITKEELMNLEEIF